MVRTGALRGRICASAAAVVGVLFGVLVGFSQPGFAQVVGQSGASTPHPGQRGPNLATAQSAARSVPAVRRGNAGNAGSAGSAGTEPASTTGGHTTSSDPSGRTAGRSWASAGSLSAGSRTGGSRTSASGRTGADRTGGMGLWGSPGWSPDDVRFAAFDPARAATALRAAGPRHTPGVRAPPAAHTA